MRNTYAARESAHRFATCLPDGRQLPPASHALLRRASCRLRHNHPDLASRPNSPFPSFQRQSDTFSFLEPRLLPYAVQSAVPRSSPGLPGTVTTPGLLACLYCRWLPRVRSRRHPPRSSSLITSRTFILRSVAKPQALIAIPYTLFDASSIASASVGCAWMVHIKSSTVASSSMAVTASAISSVACGPMMCTPRISP